MMKSILGIPLAFLLSLSPCSGCAPDRGDPGSPAESAASSEPAGSGREEPGGPSGPAPPETGEERQDAPDAGETARKEPPAKEESARPARPKPTITMVQGAKMYQVLPRDAIPAIDEPVFVKGSEALYMEDSEPILGIEFGDTPKAYPLYLLDHHEIVNDSAGGRPIAATW